MPFLVILTIISLICSTILILGTFRTYQVQHSPRQKSFVTGETQSKFPTGDYNGKVRGLKTSWLGKSFDGKNKSGINRFQDGNKTVKKYPFMTYKEKGIQDPTQEVIKIDYNISGNPLWLRFILDEIVETGPNTYLGKVHVRLLPGVAFSLGYFELTK